jgi:hypothetical protein
MKHLHYLLYLILLSSFASFGQNVYQHFSELNGMEDYNANTNLLYRIYSSNQDSFNYGYSNSVYFFNVINKIDSLFQPDFSYYSEYTGAGARGINSYDFWEKNPRKFIACGYYSGDDPTAFIDKFDNRDMFMSIIGGGRFIRISRQNDSLVYATFNYGQFYRSTTGGNSWDTAGHFNAFSLSPYNDKVLFSADNSMLYKTTDGGLTKHVVDTSNLDAYRSNNLIFYDNDTNYIYSTERYYFQNQLKFRFLVSNNSGETNSWNVMYTSPLQIYLSVDNSVAGSIYLATGRHIYHSSDFGSTFSLIQTFDRSLVGIYKKPASSKLYAATYNTIYELDGSAINIIKQIPIDKEILKFDPLDIGNKWYYKTTQPAKSIVSKEVVKDTLLANQKTFRQIKQQLFDSLSGYISYSYERIDSLTGDVYGWGTDSTEYIMDNLNHNPGDTINASRFNRLGSIVYDSIKTTTLFGLTYETRVYSTLPDPFDHYDYYLAKNIGLSFLHNNLESKLIMSVLKGAVIKGIVYGDTSTVVGITDKYPILPDKYILSQNYPNPFNPTTTIDYSIPKAGQVKLTVYNAIGSKVATILNEYKQPGNYYVQFNASNLASGIYLYRLESGIYSASKKFVLIK